ncbi:MAG: hypothetical protein ABF804_09150 [Liquorilactobacillus ghanensis]|uniref:hypothetical protein n=1 Tax=Liquorilactobacillus ghanensis TaxID=399370 RepID=UPI0039E751B0
MNQVKTTRICQLNLLFLVLIFSLLLQVFPARAANLSKPGNSVNKVLVVYDSKNTYYNGEKTIDSLQRMLTALGMKTTTTTINNYRQGTLENGGYKAVITLINWNYVNFSNQAFITDRRNFQGNKIHIGQNLQADEAHGLQANVGKLVRQQLMFKNDEVREQLPYTDSMEILNNIKGNYLTFGQLELQSNEHAKIIPFGVINNNNAYLPFWKTTGLGLIYEQQLLTKLLTNQPGKNYQPLLLITKVTPLAHLDYLKHLIQVLDKKGIHYAISATITTQNTNQKAFADYINVLKYAENHNGLIYLRMPYLLGSYLTGAVTNESLTTTITKDLRLLYSKQIYPMGIAAPNFWNHDAVLSKSGLKRADEILLLPNPKVYPTIAASSSAATYHKAYYVASLASFEKVKATHSLLTAENMEFAVPTALNVNLPRTLARLTRVEKDISKIDLTWYDFSADSSLKEMKMDNKTLTYQFGNYYVNGRQREILESNNNKHKKSKKPSSNISLIQRINNIFRSGSKVLLVVVIVSLIGLVILLIKGWQIYLDKFRRK